jgi:hypothetical protein
MTGSVYHANNDSCWVALDMRRGSAESAIVALVCRLTCGRDMDSRDVHGWTLE